MKIVGSSIGVLRIHTPVTQEMYYRIVIEVTEQEFNELHRPGASVKLEVLQP